MKQEYTIEDVMRETRRLLEELAREQEAKRDEPDEPDWDEWELVLKS